MYLRIEGKRIVVEPITREQENQLRQMAKDRVPLEVVRDDEIVETIIDSPSATDRSSSDHAPPKAC